MVSIMDDAKKRIARRVSINADNGCWEWNGCIQSNGYGRVTYKLHTMGAHRLSYLAFCGDIPAGLDVCHKCDNRKCVNPIHLFVGTRKDNMIDALRKGRIASGFALPNAKLSKRDINEIISLSIAGNKYSEIANIFSISKQHVGKIALKNGIRRNGLSK